MSVLIETKLDEIRLTVSISIDDMKTEEIEELLAFIKAEVITRKSQMTAEQAFELAEEVKASRWNENGNRIRQMIAEYESNNGR